MHYFVCIQNCLEDYYYDDAEPIMFPTADEAIAFVDSIEDVDDDYAFDAEGGLKWYFPSCKEDGCLHDPDPEYDVRDCYQIINVIPSDKSTEYIEETYGNDSRSIYNRLRCYTINYLGDVKWKN